MKTWAIETMELINKLTPDIKGKAFDPDWFLLRQHLERFETEQNKLTYRNQQLENELRYCLMLIETNLQCDSDLRIEYAKSLLAPR